MGEAASVLDCYSDAGPVRQRILNGFEIRLFGCYFWLNAYGVGVGVLNGRQFNYYRGWAK